MKYSERLQRISFLFIVWLALFCLYQSVFSYYFFAQEATNLFLYSGSYLSDHLIRPGGLATYLSKFVIQFYIYPYAGPALLALILTCVCRQIMAVLHKLTANPYILLYLVPVTALLFIGFEMNYYLSGTIALSLALGAFQGYLYVKTRWGRLVYSAVLIPVLFWLAGSVCVLFTALVVLWECLNRPRQFYWFLLPVAEMLLVCAGSVLLSIVGEFRFAFLPDMYFHPLITDIPPLVYYTWLSVPLVIFLAWAVRKRKAITWKRALTENLLQLVIVCVITWTGIPKYGKLRSLKFMEIDYHARMENWEEVKRICTGNLNNLLYVMDLNIALANKGELADRMFHYDQKGPKGLYPKWNNTYPVAVILSDFHYVAGNIAGALHMAFEGNITSNNESVRMMKRMVDCYLILGNYQVAGRYIRILEQTLAYKDWATGRRKFLYNDEAVNNDPVLGDRRRNIMEKNLLYTAYTPEYILFETASHYSANKTALEYLSAGILLMKDMQSYEKFLNDFYGSDILPALPVSLQEAAFILYENNEQKWKELGIPESKIQHFRSFRKDFQESQRNPSLRGSLERKYRNTYWYYYMYK